MPDDRVGAVRVEHAFTPSREEAEREAADASWAEQVPGFKRQCEDGRLLLLLRFPFFGHLALRLEWRFTERISRWAMRADGTIYFNPIYLESLRAGQVAFILAHAVLHLAHGHFARCEDRDSGLWNQAVDAALAPTLRSTRLPPPPDFDLSGSMSESGFHLDAELEYEKRLGLRRRGRTTSDPWGGPGPLPRNREPGDCDFGATQTLVALGFDPIGSWRTWARAARISARRAKGVGRLSHGMERFLSGNARSLLPWTALLRRFVHENLESRSDWSRPARRAPAVTRLVTGRTGISTTLPGRRTELAPVVVALDLSASISGEQANRMLSETRAILQAYRRPIRTLTFDVEVHEDRSIRSVAELKPRGGGGTSFVPLFQKLEEDRKRNRGPACVVVFTDLHSIYPAQAPPFPVVFVDVDGTFGDPPFGHLIRVNSSAAGGI